MKPFNMPSARSKSKRVTVPLTLLQLDAVGSHLLIPVEINRLKSCYFVIDTGASSSVIDAGIKGLKPVLSGNDISSFALGDDTLQTSFRVIPKFSIGGVEFNHITMAALDLSGLRNTYKRLTKLKVAGLLGGDFLLSGQAVIDYRKQCISFNARNVMMTAEAAMV